MLNQSWLMTLLTRYKKSKLVKTVLFIYFFGVHFKTTPLLFTRVFFWASNLHFTSLHYLCLLSTMHFASLT